MLSIFARSFMTATRSEPRSNCGDRLHSEPRNHWGDHQRFDTRKDAEIEAHTIARRRD